ncbi:hypothetical protein OO009_01330 [Flavobacteriaceae bacterium KMM 6897]|nr:hypothetical protein [Flavobacteriaceae bacterium KMM 6897]
MKNRIKFSFVTLFFSCLSIITYGQDTLNSQQLKIIKTMNLLSETTAPDGKGADSYGSYLSNDFSRWTIGSSITNNKKKWVEGVREWFDDGWRVSERKQQNLEIQIMGNYAHTRRIVAETYLGPKGEIATSKAALAEIWIKENDKWLLYRVNVHPMEND